MNGKQDQSTIELSHLLQQRIDAVGVFDQECLEVVSEGAFNEVCVVAVGFDQVTEKPVNSRKVLWAFEHLADRFAESFTFPVHLLEQVLP